MGVAIVGGGITGLCTALHLERAGMETTVYEASDVVGGPMQTVRRNGYLAENGPHTILESNDAVTRLLSELDLEDDVIYASDAAKERYVVRDGRPVPLPTSPPKLLSTDLWSTRAKLRLLAEPFIDKRDAVDDESLADFVRRRLGDELLDYGVGVLVNGIWAGDAEKLSARYSFGKLFELERDYGSIIGGGIRRAFSTSGGKKRRGPSPMLSFRNGNGALAERLSERLDDVRTATRVEAVTSTADGLRLTCRHGDGTYTADHDLAVVTAPPHALAKIDFDQPADFADDISAPAVSVVTLGFRRADVEHPLDGFGVLVPVVEDFDILGTLFCSTLFEGRAPAGHVTLATYIGGSRRPELARLSPPERADLVLRDLRRLLGITGEPTFDYQRHWSHAIPQYEVGWGRMRVAMQAFEKLNPGVMLAGNIRDGIAVPDLIESAEHVADEILQRFRSNSAA